MKANPVELVFNAKDAKHIKYIFDERTIVDEKRNQKMASAKIIKEKIKEVFLYRVITIDKEYDLLKIISETDKLFLQKASSSSNAGLNLIYENPSEAIKILKEAVQYFELAGGYEVKGDIFNDIGLAYYWTQMYDEALYCFNKALEIFKNNDWERYVGVLINRASLCEKNNEWNKAIEDLNNAYQITIENNFNDLQIIVLNNIAYILYCNNKPEESIKKYNKILSLKLMLNYRRISIAQTYFNLAIIHEDLKNYITSIVNFKKCLEYLEPKFDEKKLGENLFQIATIEQISNLQYLIEEHIAFFNLTFKEKQIDL